MPTFFAPWRRRARTKNHFAVFDSHIDMPNTSNDKSASIPWSTGAICRILQKLRRRTEPSGSPTSSRTRIRSSTTRSSTRSIGYCLYGRASRRWQSAPLQRKEPPSDENKFAKTTCVEHAVRKSVEGSTPARVKHSRLSGHVVKTVKMFYPRAIKIGKYIYTKRVFFLDAAPRDTPSHFTQNMAGAGASAPADRGPPSPPQTRGGRQEAAPRSLTNKRGANGTGPAEMAPSKKRLKITIDERIATGWQPTGSVWPQLIPGTPGPDEHITSALQLNPFEKALEAALPQARKNLIKWAAECPGESVRFKAENANKIERLAKQTGRAQSAPRAGPFLRSINLTLLDRLSKEAGNPDPLLVRDIAEGMKISGKEGAPHFNPPNQGGRNFRRGITQAS